jgi:microcystin-dependent protein
MTQPFLGQVQPFGFGFAPRGWALCNGQILSISQNTALFALLGTFYGGNGTTNFALPNLQSRVPMHYGSNVFGSFALGEQAGQEGVTLSVNELPTHNHSFSGTTADADSKRPVDGSAYAQTTTPGPVSPGDSFYAQANAGTVTTINPLTLSIVGGSLPHSNLQPYLTINWCIAMQGVFPARN